MKCTLNWSSDNSNAWGKKEIQQELATAHRCVWYLHWGSKNKILITGYVQKLQNYLPKT